MTAEQQRHYDECRAGGACHSLAEMFALGAAPQSRTDAEFFRGRWNQFADTPHLGDAYRGVAEAHGQSTTGKVYLSGLARFPGDPEAWVSGRGDVERVIDRHGWGAEGSVTRPLRNVAEPEVIPVAPDIVDAKVADILAGVDPRDRPRVDVEDLREQVVERHKGPWCK
jgi:hypothetical protein